MGKMRNITRLLNVVVIIGIASYLISCGAGESNLSPGGTSTGTTGSLARFAVKDNKIFTLSGENAKTYTIESNGSLTLFQTLYLNSSIETIFCRKDALFVGTSSGMFIYSLTGSNYATYKSFYSHIYSCDPVVADDSFAYVTLNSTANNRCWRGINALEIIDITSLTTPALRVSYNMSSPQGLGIDSNYLFVCDDHLKMYDKSNVDSLVLLHSFNVKANDVIPFNHKLMLTSSTGFYQYSYANGDLTLLSSILIGQ